MSSNFLINILILNVFFVQSVISLHISSLIPHNSCIISSFIVITDSGVLIWCAIAGIFDRFMSRKSQDEFHAGIGLNLSKLIIEAHHGNIRAGNSDKYGGAQFKIILPLYKFKGKL